MRLLPRTVLLAAVALPLFASFAEGEARKCPGGVQSSSNVPLVALDGALVDASALDLEALDILAMEVGCVMLEREGQFVAHNGIAILTRSGAAEFMRSYLDQLVNAQEAFRSAQGRYAADLYSLAFFSRRPVFSSGIEMVATDGRWTATMSFEELDTSSHVSWAIFDVDRRDPQVAGVICQ